MSVEDSEQKNDAVSKPAKTDKDNEHYEAVTLRSMSFLNRIPASKNSLLARRSFLKKGILLGTSGVLFSANAIMAKTVKKSSQSMLVPGQGFSNYGLPADYESHTIRWISANDMAQGNGVSWTPLGELQGTITPSGLHFERHHNGVPDIDPKRHQLLIHGKVKRPLTFSIDALMRYPLESRTCFIECGGNSNAGWHKRPVQSAVGHFHGLVSNSEWTGVPLSILLEEVGIDESASWLIAEAADGIAMNISIPLAKAMDDAILALYQNGERLRPENGYPLRLLLPGWEGVTNVKWLRRLHITDKPIMSRNETAKYTELLPSGKARQFSFVMDVKSLITSPSAGHQLEAAGLYQISGLAWSGKGKIAKVEISVDGGITWTKAGLQMPILSKSFTRFSFPWSWTGESAVLMSRAVDEYGNIQPDREALVNQRGRHGYYHYNAIVCWEVSTSGFVSHVYA